MTKFNQFTIDNNMIFNKEQVSEKIKELVLLTKQVNSKKTSEDSVIGKETIIDNWI